MIRTVRFASLLLFLFLSTAAFTQKITGKVSKVKDGDSFVLMAGNKAIEVRLDGIDCPEKGQAYGNSAKQFTSTKIYQQNITIKILGYDKYKRALAVAYLGGNVILNEELLKSGMAWHYKKYNKDERLAKMETKARKLRLGLWRDPNPIPPWQYRQLQRKK